MRERHPHEERLVVLESRQIIDFLDADIFHFVIVIHLQAAHAGPSIDNGLRINAGGPVALASDPVRRSGEVGGVNIGGDAFVETMHLIGADEVHLTAKHRVIIDAAQIVG